MSTFGNHFRVHTYGESHCLSVGVVVDGCPPCLQLTEADIQPQLTRRRPGQSAISTPRDEKDRVEIQSGIENGITLGSPIAMRVMNENQRPKDYGNKTMDKFPRPSHADWTYQEKYGIRASSGGGRSSARETIGRVAAGAIAEKVLRDIAGVEIVAFVSSIGNEFLFPPTATHPSPSTNPEFLKMLETIDRKTVDSFVPVRCPNQEAADRMEKLIADFRDKQDSIGGTVTCVIRNVPVGLGEPCFDKLEATLAHAMLSIPATKGFEIGSGFGGCRIPGSIHNDPFIKAPAIPPSQSGLQSGIPRPRLTTKTNNSGGIQGGISNGAHIYFTVAFKPPATIGQAQHTTTYDEEEGVLEAKGRHDPSVVPRAIPIVEAMAAITLMDAFLAQQARASTRDLIQAAQANSKKLDGLSLNGS
ncbi:chorismate synthase-like protein [Tothia fuscella]|uniref:Chorismate synthase n=1 Tax=Tothia fuscella TaxID=1048955 RepID=A0A9P4TSL5_9PEZI|nr:chorismate synthase-like protein [Tothia fuscella]